MRNMKQGKQDKGRDISKSVESSGIPYSRISSKQLLSRSQTYSTKYSSMTFLPPVSATSNLPQAIIIDSFLYKSMTSLNSSFHRRVHL
jgi:hypothetical protein